MNFRLLIVFILIANLGYTQSGKLKKADDLYNRLAYADAVVLYNELLGSEVDSPEMKSKLGNCYYQIGETSKSEEIYAKVVETEKATVEDVYNYSQSLKENGKYAESDKWMQKFHRMRLLDSRGKEFAENTLYVQTIQDQDAYFSINHLSVNTKHTDFGGYPMHNGSAYFVSNRKNWALIRRSYSWNDKTFLDLYSAKISDNQDLENVIRQSRRVNKKFHEGPLCFSSNTTKVYFTRNNMSTGKMRRDEKGIQNLKLFSADVDEQGNWRNEKEFDINSKEYSVGHPTLSEDEKYLYFASDMPGGFGGADIYRMSINADGTYGNPENLGSDINTEGQEMFPWMGEDGLLFFASDGHVGLGGLDVFVMIPNKDGSFKKLLNVGLPINSPKDDFALILNKDNLSGYVSSNRTTGTGDDDIYSVKLLRPFKVNLRLNGVVTDVRTNEILPGAIVKLIDGDGKAVASTIADDKGAYEFDLEPEIDYTITASKDYYYDNSTSFTTKNLSDDVEELKEDVDLEKDPGLSLYALIIDAKTKMPLEGVQLIITDNISGDQVEFQTLESGDYLKPLLDKNLDDRGSYNLSMSKEGYIPKTVTYNTLFDKEGRYDVHASLDLSLDRMVTDLAELIEINPINFDLNKAIIRPDAKVELDKIVIIMNKYPEMVVELGSHTDCRASREYNRALSDRRAKSSAEYIKSKITKPERIYGKGYGESQLLNGCECEGNVKSDCSEEEHEKNRRTEFKVISVGNSNVKVQNKSSDSFEKE